MAYCPRKNRKRLIYPRDRYQLCGRGTLLLLSETCACIIYKTIKKCQKRKRARKKRKYPRIISGESYVRNSLLGGDAKIMSRSFIAFSTLGGWRYKIGALKGDTNLLLLVVTLLVSWNVTNSHPNSAGGRYSSGMSIFFSDTASYRCALGLNHRLFLLTCHPTKREGKKRPHQSTLLCVKKNKAGGERVVSENDLGYLMSWPCQ